MASFGDLEKKYRGVAVRPLTDGNLYGVLTLARNDTMLVLTGDHPFKHKTDENGWFDIHLRLADGDVVLLHNALETSRAGGASRQSHIYPNIVLIGREDKLDLVRSISFTLKGLDKFFNYQHIEWQPAWRLPLSLKEAIRSLRELQHIEFGDWTREYEFFKPDDFYIKHRLPRAFKFRLEDRCYEVWTGGSQKGHGWGQIHIQTEPVAQVVFDHETSIDRALEVLWEWRRFFEQVAMETMALSEIRGKVSRKAVAAAIDIYIPSLDERSTAETLLRAHAGDIPLNQWHQRRQFSMVLKAWLERDAARAFFRQTLASVQRDMRQRSEITDIVKLCAAIESLDELRPEPAYSKDIVKKMATAATEAAASNNFTIAHEVVQNSLSALRRPSLASRFRMLGERVQPTLSEDDCALVFDNARKLRNISVHGNAKQEFQRPIVAPIVEALVSVCTLFDLTTSGMPLRGQSGSLPCIHHFRQSVSEIRYHLSGEPLFPF